VFPGAQQVETVLVRLGNRWANSNDLNSGFVCSAQFSIELPIEEFLAGPQMQGGFVVWVKRLRSGNQDEFRPSLNSYIKVGRGLHCTVNE
jgi:hypothetical protein